MSDITKDDLRVWRGMDTVQVSGEEFKRLVREWLTQGSNAAEITTAIARDWIFGNRGKALSALLTDECPNPECDEGWVHRPLDQRPPRRDKCPHCGGRGWLPNKKAQELLDNLHDYVAKAPEVAQDPRIFADWLEAEDE